MAHAYLSHRRTHNLLLISKLLSLRDTASPFSLILDTLEQTAKPLLKECIRRANASKTHTILVSFETLRAPNGIDTFILAWQFPSHEIAKSLNHHIDAACRASPAKRFVIFIDSLHTLCSVNDPSFSLPMLLTSLLMPSSAKPSAQTSMMAVYHTDVPDPAPTSEHEPNSLALLSYTATTILTVHSLPDLVDIRAAESRSSARPAFGLAEEREGIIIGLPSSVSNFTRSRSSNHPTTPSLTPEHSGLVIEMEHRRKSGRGVQEWYFLPSSPKHLWSPQNQKEHITLLDDHPLFRKPDLESEVTTDNTGMDGLSFDLNLTERQRREREGVVLPYFDAQRGGAGGGGPGEGGRILYDMGSEDDFDEEEDEI